MNYSGNGDVYKQGQKVARVRYDLVQTTTFIDTDPSVDTGHGRAERVKGLSSTGRTAGGGTAGGTVVVVIGKIEIGEEYELRLDNGNTVSFYPNHHSANRPSHYMVTVW